MANKKINANSDLVKEIYNFDPKIIESVTNQENLLELEINFFSMDLKKDKVKREPVLKVRNGKIVAQDYDFVTSIGKTNENLERFLKFVSNKGKEISYLQHIARIFSTGEENEIENTRNYNFEHFYRRARREIYDVSTLKTDSLYETTIKKGREYLCLLEGKEKDEFPTDYKRKVEFDLNEIFNEE